MEPARAPPSEATVVGVGSICTDRATAEGDACVTPVYSRAMLRCWKAGLSQFLGWSFAPDTVWAKNQQSRAKDNGHVTPDFPAPP